MMTPRRHADPIEPTIIYPSPTADTRLVVWPAVGDNPPVVQIDEGEEDGRSLAVPLEPKDGPKIVAAILAAVQRR